MVEHVPAHAQLEEEEMVGPMNTPFVSPSQPIGKYHCNDIVNNKICISIITMHLYIYIKCMVFAWDASLQWPPCPTIRCTKSMVWERIPTQSIEREETTTTMVNNNELYFPILEFMEKKM